MFTQSYVPLSRWNETLIAVADCSLLNEQSYKKVSRQDSLSAKQRFYNSVTGNNLIMTLYFSCLLECTELLIDIFSLAASLKSLFQRWPWQIGSTIWFIFHCIFIYFCSLIFPWSLPSFRHFHTHSFPLICYSIPFTLLNITENSVAINKLNCGRRAFMRTLWSAWYHAHLFYGRLRHSYLYLGGQIYFVSKICFLY